LFNQVYLEIRYNVKNTKNTNQIQTLGTIFYLNFREICLIFILCWLRIPSLGHFDYSLKYHTILGT
jgi:hypothetical protein